MVATLTDLQKQIDTKNEQALSIYESAKDSGLTETQLADIRTIQGEIKELEKKANDTQEGEDTYRELQERKQRLNAPVNRYGHGMPGDVPGQENANGRSSKANGPKPGQTWGEFFTQHPDIKGWQDQTMPHGRVPAEKTRVTSPAVEMPGLNFKDLITGSSVTSAGALVQTDFRPLVLLPRRPLTLRDLITVVQTNSDNIEYPRITGYTNNAAGVAEATGAGDATGAKPESAMALEKVPVPIKTIANWIPVSKRSLSDAPLIRSLIDEFLMYNLEEELEDQIASATGAGETLDGIFHVSGTTQQAWDTDMFTTTRKALTKAKVVGRSSRVNGWLMNPYDVQALDLLANNEKNFYMGGPTMQGNQMLWGKPIVESEAVPQGQAVVGDFKTVILFDREQATIQMTDSHADFFVRNLVAILAEMRAGLGYARPAALTIVDVAA